MNTAVSRKDWVGRVIDGRFPLIEWLGSTDQAGVFRTELEEPQARRAVIRLVPADQEVSEERLREWAEAAALSHPHLMRIWDSGRAQVGGIDLLYVVTEYAEESLAEVIPERPLSAGEVRVMLPPVLDALSYLHAQGLVHGHIKPSNIMVVEDRLKLPVESVRRAGKFRGPGARPSGYDAPELDLSSLSPAADIWSLGITLVESLTQTPLRWDRSTKSEPVISSEISQPFADIARAALRYDPAKRASLQELRSLLMSEGSPQEPANEFDPVGPAAITEQTQMTGGDQSRHRMVVIGAGIILVLLVIAFFAMRSHKPERSSPSVAQSPASPAANAPAPAVTPAPANSSAAPPSTPSGETARGAVAQRIMPDVAASANRTIHGKVEVRVRLDVDANGAVSGARFDARGSSRYFAAKALEAAQKWTFKPALQNGRSVPSVWALRFDFRRGGPEVKAEEVSP